MSMPILMNRGTKTTLIEGRIKVTAEGQTENLKPGQQAIITTGASIKIKDVDLEEITAWKNGYFDLNKENPGKHHA